MWGDILNPAEGFLHFKADDRWMEKDCKENETVTRGNYIAMSECKGKEQAMSKWDKENRGKTQSTQQTGFCVVTFQ